MKKHIMEKWVAKLESGEYEQGHGSLRPYENKFCCLGVLCNIHAQEHPEIAALETDPNKYLGNAGYLPPKVQRWAGMNTDNGHLLNYCNYLSLAGMNDSGETFKTIAKVIRKNYKDL